MTKKSHRKMVSAILVVIGLALLLHAGIAYGNSVQNSLHMYGPIQVLDGETGLPVQGAYMTVTAGVLWDAYSDANGMVVLYIGNSAVTYWTVSAEGYETAYGNGSPPNPVLLTPLADHSGIPDDGNSSNSPPSDNDGDGANDNGGSEIGIIPPELAWLLTPLEFLIGIVLVVTGVVRAKQKK